MAGKIISKQEKRDRVDLVIEIPWKDFSDAELKAYKNGLKEKEGKVLSLDEYRKRFGESVFYNEAFEIIKSTIIPECIASLEYDFTALPDMTIKEINRGNSVLSDVVLHIEPDVEIKNYKGIKASGKSAAVSEEELEANLQGLVRKYIHLEEVDRAVENGDTVNFNFEGFVDGVPFEGGKAENYDLEIGSGQFINGFEEQLIGMNRGETRTIHVTFPDEYTPELSGKDADFVCSINQVSEKISPELDDEFAKSLTDEKGEHFNDLAELRKSLKARLEAVKKSETELNLRDDLLVRVIELNDIDLPDIMYETEIETQMKAFIQQLRQNGIEPEVYYSYTGTDESRMRESLRERSIISVKGRKALKEIAKLEGITVAKEDIEREFSVIAGQYNVSVEKMKESLGPEYEKFLTMDIKSRKAMEKIVEYADISWEE